ncbi:MAG TPA: single-stranded DNA-binding protein [Thermotogota bacterium]|nr:single-stranded DNA-binding protein [Thermotogota bacterium]
MNKVLLTGRVGKDIEAKTSNGGNMVAKFSLAVSRYVKGGENTTDWINCVAFGKTAEMLEQHVEKGVLILVEGNIKTGSYEGKDGLKRYTTDVIVEKFEFLEKKKSGESVGQPAKAVERGVEDEETIPF